MANTSEKSSIEKKRADKSLDENHVPPELIKFRKDIDAIDTELIALINKRCDIVSKVGEYKKKKGATGCFIRAGREADMVRFVHQEFTGTKFNPVAAAAIWRLIIAASTRIESDLRVAVYAPDQQDKLFWLAREYFGSFSEVSKHPNTNRVVGDVVNGKAEVGILPAFTDEDGSDWWVTLSQQEGDAPVVFAQVPFVASKSETQRFASFAIGRIEPEPTDDDMTLLAVHTSDVSINKLMAAFATAGLKATRVQFINHTASGMLYHLIRLDGFVRADDNRLAKVRDQLGEIITLWKWLGAYATPILTRETC